VTLLTAEALDLGDGHALDADFRESLLNLLEFKGLDDGDNEFHAGEYLGVRSGLGFSPKRRKVCHRAPLGKG
jgi:hypothetical protein